MCAAFVCEGVRVRVSVRALLCRFTAWLLRSVWMRASGVQCFLLLTARQAERR